jgi:A/G-specific adenine glycosylase
VRSETAARKIELIRQRLVPWFREIARDLPWRRTQDPYRIWLSEIMLQQTRVGQAESYYERFVDQYPTVHDLAGANLDTVLRDWEGLGYYARARNMHRAAQMIVRDMGGRFPDTHDEVRSLPGVGPYTAAAVMSIAYDEPYAAVDGNVVRVISRLFEMGFDPSSAEGKRAFQDMADALLDEERPGTFNEAMMELGATVCLPSAPKCDQCPLASLCSAFENGRTDRFPVRRAKQAIPHYDVAVAVISRADGRVFIQRRDEDGLLGGLWEFSGGKTKAGELPEEACHREALEELGVGIKIQDRLATVDHAYSHFRVTLHPFLCQLAGGQPATRLRSRWVKLDQLDGIAFPRANRRIIDSLASMREFSGRDAAGEVHCGETGRVS